MTYKGLGMPTLNVVESPHVTSQLTGRLCVEFHVGEFSQSHIVKPSVDGIVM